MSDACPHCIPCSLQRIEESQRRIEETLSRMENSMANEREQLNVINQQVQQLQNDVNAKLDQVRAEVSPEGQQAIDEIRSSLESFAAQIGDADGSDTAGQTPPEASQLPAEPVGPDNATDESGTPVDAKGNPRA